MRKEITYREIKEKDSASLCALLPAVGKETAAQIIKESILGRREKRFVAVNAERVVAHINAEFSGEPYAHIAELRSLVVLPEYRGQGIAHTLYSHALAVLGKEKEIAIARVRTTNTPSIKLHEKLGFKEIGKMEKGWKQNGKQADILIFSREI